MNKLIICVGISGSGKSTWATNFIKNNYNYVRINRDDIRKVLVGDLEGYYNRKDLSNIETKITNIETLILFNMSGYNIVIDNTNLTIKYINRWIDIANKYKFDINFKLFDCNDINTAKQRVIDRCNYPMSLDKDHTNVCKYVDYIDKQYQQYSIIREYIYKSYSNDILE